jgi:hypothetical protein
MLSITVLNASTILRYNDLSHEIYVEQYVRGDVFKYSCTITKVLLLSSNK